MPPRRSPYRLVIRYMILFYFIFPPHGDIRPCGLAPSRKLIFYSPHGDIDFLFASRRNRFPICLTANVDFIFLTPPHGEIDFLFASRRNRFSIQPHGECRFYFTLTDSRRNRFSIHLTANVDFIALHGVDQFSLRLTARTDFIPPTRCFVPQGDNQCSFSLTARLGFIPICA